MGGVTGMAAIAMAILLLGALWSLMALAIAHLCATLFGVYDTAATKPNQLEMWANAQPDGRPAEYR